jgi:hypothetical protein
MSATFQAGDEARLFIYDSRKGADCANLQNTELYGS